MINSREMTIAVLAGGKSRRFGSPKEKTIFRGRSFLKHALKTAGEIGDTVFVVAGDNPIDDCPVPVHRDIYPDRGPLGGIYTALKLVETAWLAVLPCDAPLLTAGVYRRLQEQAQPDRPAVARSPRGIEPLVSLWPQSALPLVESNLLKGKLSLHTTLRELQAVEVEMSAVSPEVFLNVNRPEDLQRLLALEKERTGKKGEK